MKLSKVLIVYKKSAFETYFKRYNQPHLQKFEKQRDGGLLHIRRSHQTHYDSLKKVETVLKKHGIACKHVYRGKAFDEKAFDLVISLGGDGTFLDAAHFVRQKMILGVNSDTSHSVGRFCQTDEAHFERALEKIKKNKFKTLSVQRMTLKLNGKKFSFPVLNDALVTHACPGAMSHYELTVSGKKEQQRSSGVWIATAAGSTGALKSAGGKVLKIDQAQFQYKPRELYSAHGARYALTGGGFGHNQSVKVVSKMQDGMIFIDGAHLSKPFRYGDRLEASFASEKLNLIFL